MPREESAMPFTANPNPRRPAIMSEAVEQYCSDCGIVDEQEREYVAEMVNSLFDLGVETQADLRGRLEEAMGPARRKA